MAHDHIDFNKVYMVMISITVYIHKVEYLAYYSYYKNIREQSHVNNIAKHQSNIYV